MKRVVLSFGIFYLTVLFFSCKGPAPQNQMQGGPVPVNVFDVKSQETTYYDFYPATTVALNQVEVRSELNGYVTGIFFKEGFAVKKGQKLYEIDRSKYAASYQQAEASVQIAESNVEKAQKDFDRYNFLLQKEAIAKQRVDYATTDLRNAKQQVAAAKADLTKASVDLRHSIIIAPFDGTIGISTVKLGTFVTAGQTVLNTISSDDPIAVDFSVNEKEITRFMHLKNDQTNPEDSIFTIMLPDKSIYNYPGKIEFFDRAVDPLTGTLKIRLQFPNPDHSLRAGMSCDLRVLSRTKGKVVIVPYKAVTEQMGEYFVYVVERDTAKQQKVMIGPQVGSNVIVLNGLEPGKKIVIEGIQKLRDRTPVTLGIPGGNNPSGQPTGQNNSSGKK
jgi:membrane fusion protein (multidrug efflux system)